MTVFFSPPSPGQTSVSGAGTLTSGLAHSPTFFFTEFFQAALSMKTHTSEVCPSCQFGGQDPSVGTCFLESYPQPKPPSKVQSSQAHLTVGPHRAINLSSPAHLPTIGRLIFYVGSDSKWFTSQHKIETCAYKSEKDLAGNWIPSDSWLPPLIGLWISPCIANVMGHTPHGSPASTAVWAVGAVVFVSAWCHSHCALYTLSVPPGTGGSLLSHRNPSSIWKQLSHPLTIPPNPIFSSKAFSHYLSVTVNFKYSLQNKSLLTKILGLFGWWGNGVFPLFSCWSCWITEDGM